MSPIPRTNADGTPRARRAGQYLSRRLGARRLGLWRVRYLAPLALGLMLSACSTLGSISDTLLGTHNGPQPGQAGYVKGFVGEVVADEPRAALAGKEVLSAGGDAADAAVAVGMSLAVTLPSRAGLGGGGACIAYTVNSKSAAKGVPEAILFVPPAVRSVIGGDRPAAVPTLARGLYLLHLRHGRLPFETLLNKAELLARFGVPVSAALSRDLALVAGPLFSDPAARTTFGAGGAPLTQGQGMIQPDLAATLAEMRSLRRWRLLSGRTGAPDRAAIAVGRRADRVRRICARPCRWCRCLSWCRSGMTRRRSCRPRVASPPPRR